MIEWTFYIDIIIFIGLIKQLWAAPEFNCEFYPTLIITVGSSVQELCLQDGRTGLYAPPPNTRNTHTQKNNNNILKDHKQPKIRKLLFNRSTSFL